MSRAAMLTPLPPQRTGIADYAVTVIERLAERIELDVYSLATPLAQIGAARVRRFDGRARRRLDRYDAVVAQVGNSVAHDWILEVVRSQPTFVVAHELGLHHLVAAATVGRGDREAYLQAVRAEGGEGAVRLALESLEPGMPGLWETAADRLPLTNVALVNARGVLVHSRYMADALRIRRPDLPAEVVPFPAPVVNGPSSRHGAPDAPITFGVFGFITANKRMPAVLSAFAHCVRRLKRVRLLIVGGVASGIDISATVRAYGLPDATVEVHDYADRAEYERLMAAVDIGICLRAPTLGETSAVVVDFMARGVPVVVSTGGWYDELPDEGVARVPPDEDETVRLAAALEYLATDSDARGAMGAAATEYARTALSADRTADAYVRAVLGQVGRGELQASLEQVLARSIADVGGALGLATGAMSERAAVAAREVGLL